MGAQNSFPTPFNDVSPSLMTDDMKEKIEEIKKQAVEEQFEIPFRKTSFEILSENERSDYETVLAAVKKDGYNIKYINCEFLKNDLKIIISAILNKRAAYKCLSEDLQQNPTLLLIFNQRRREEKEGIYDPFLMDKQTVLQVVGKYGNLLELASDKLRKDKQVVLRAITNNFTSLKFSSKELLEDKDFIIEVLSRNLECFTLLNPDLQNDRDFIILLLENRFKIIPLLSDKYKSDKEIIKVALKYGCLSLEDLGSLSKEMFNDKELILEALSYSTINNLQFISEEMRGDYDIIIKCLENSVESSRYIPHNFNQIDSNFKRVITDIISSKPHLLDKLDERFWLNDMEMILFAVKKSNLTLKLLPKKMREDKEWVLLCVTHCPLSLEYAPERMKFDYDIVLKCLETSMESSKFISSKFNQFDSNYKKVIMKLIEKTPQNLHKFHPRFWAFDKEMITHASKHSAQTLEILKNQMRFDRDLVLNCVSIDGRYLEYASNELKEDYEIVVKSLESNIISIQFISPNFTKFDSRFHKPIYENLLKNTIKLTDIQERYWNSSLDIVLYLVKQNAEHYKSASPEVKKDKEITYYAVLSNGILLSDAPFELQNDRDIVITALKNNPVAMQYASEKLLNDRVCNLIYRKMFDIQKDSIEKYENILFHFE